MKKYQPKEIENKWQKKWKEEKLYSPDIDKSQNPYYALMMFPYPSAEGLHVGNMYPFTGTDIFARFKRMQGFDVLEPIGLDGFGIHSENYALKVNQHPMDLSKITEKRFYEQLTEIGDAYDWTRTVETYKPEYYKWTQWLFLQMYKKGLAYKKAAEVNWCPSCKTVLADEQVIAGVCERCGSKVEKKNLEQWFFKITDYADRLLDNLDWIDWTDKVKIAQRNWIGKKTGINISYKIEESNEEVTVFTTRPDTNFGTTFIVLAPEHQLVKKITKKENLEEVDKYIKTSLSKSDEERMAEGRTKTGVFTGAYAINNLNGKRLPIWVSDFVLGGFGTGAVVGVPGHDIRDFEFAKQFGLEIIRVVVGKDGDKSEITEAKQVQEEEGTMVNSQFLDGLDIHEATQKIMDYLEEKTWGERVTTYHLRDWLISRQRYWGPPIPIIYCDECGTVPVSEKDLPVELPFVENFRPTGTGKAPLASVEEFYNVKCPNCGGPAKRETDVSDTFLDSAWYFLRYPNTELEDKAFDEARIKKWLPVDMYIGGAEHSVLHLLYSRFVTMVLKDLGFLDFEEPFEHFKAHGLIISEGAKMSKSKGNVINPDKYIKEYGADTLRMYLMFMGPFSEGGDFRDAAIGGLYRFLTRVWDLILNTPEAKETENELKTLNKTIKKVGEDISELHFNTAISSLMKLLNILSSQKSASKETKKKFMLLLAPFAPHITEELWDMLNSRQQQPIRPEGSRPRRLGSGSIHQQSWPTVNEKYLEEEEISVIVQVNGRVREQLTINNEQLTMKKEDLVKLALESQKVKKFVDGKEIKKTIYVQGKVLNLVVSD